MRKILTLFLSLLLTACAPSPPHHDESTERSEITATRVERSDVDSDAVIVLKPNRDETAGLTVGELLQQMNDNSFGFPTKNDYSSCDELISIIHDSDDVSMVEAAENYVVAKSERATMTYNFPNRGCSAY